MIKVLTIQIYVMRYPSVSSTILLTSILGLPVNRKEILKHIFLLKAILFASQFGKRLCQNRVEVFDFSFSRTTCARLNCGLGATVVVYGHDKADVAVGEGGRAGEGHKAGVQSSECMFECGD